MVHAYVHQSGKPHGSFHTELRRVVQRPSAEQKQQQLRRRVAE